MTQENLSTSINYDEAVDGDISNDPDNPTQLTLSPGTTTLSASSGDGDEEYLTVTIPDGFELDSLVLESITPERNVAFIAVQEGDKFTEPLNRETTEIGNLLGYNLFGEPRQVGTDILDNIGDGFGAIGFEGALPAGEYTFVLRQAGVVSDYTLAFNVGEASEPEEDDRVYEGWDDYIFEFDWNYSRVDNDDADPLYRRDNRLAGREDTEPLEMSEVVLPESDSSEAIVDLPGWGMGFEDATPTQPDSDAPIAGASDWSFVRDFDFTNFSADDFAFG